MKQRSMLFLTLCLGLMLNVSACANSQSKETQSHQHHSPTTEIALGDISITALKEGYPHFFHEDDFQEDPVTIEQLKSLATPLTITVFFGTWCHDSQREVPRLLTLLHEVNNPNIELKLIALSLQKDEPGNRAKHYKITNTPTFVVEKDGQEIGRITEVPRQSAGKDLLHIIQ